MKTVIFKIALVALLFAAQSAAQPLQRADLWQKEIDAFSEIDRRQTPPAEAVLFVGSSSIRGWRSLAEDFPQMRFINRGFGGSHMEDVNFYFDQTVAPYKPKKIVLYAGDNDLTAGKTPERVLADFIRFVGLVREKTPKSKIYYISIKPSPARWNLREKFQMANRLLKAECEKDRNTEFIDVWTPMLGDDGEPKAEIFLADKLHMNEKGYLIWREVLAKYLK